MDERIRELLLLGSSEKSVSGILDAYHNGEHHFIAMLPIDVPQAIIAYRIEDNSIEILDIAVEEIFRHRGFGSRLIIEMISRHTPAQVIAETDDDAVVFYQKLGFTTDPFQSKWGIRRYRLHLNCGKTT